MQPQAVPNFHSAVIYTYLFNAPALLIAVACAYGGARMIPWFYFGTAVMGLVFAANLYTQLRHIKRAEALVARAQPVAMLLTTDAGWHDMRLCPAQRGSGLPTISNIGFLTRLSGVPRAAHRQTPVQVYLDAADPDVVVLHINECLLLSDITNRYSQAGTAPVRAYAPEDAAIMANAGTQDPAALHEGIARLAAETQLYITMVAAGGAALTIFSSYMTGAWQTIDQWTHTGTPSLGSLANLLFPLAAVIVIILILRKLTHNKGMILRAQEVVRTATPAPYPLLVTGYGRNEEGNHVSWQVTIGATPTYNVLLVVNMNDAYAKVLSGTTGLVYATPQPDAPIVIHTENGILIGERER